MSRLASLLFLLCALGFLALLFGPSTVMIRFVHHEFPGGSLALARNEPISLKPGIGSQYFFRWIDSDSSIALRCGFGDGATEKQMGYITPGMHYYVDLEVDGCDVKKFTESWFP